MGLVGLRDTATASWDTVVEGLALYTSALTWRLYLLVGSYAVAVTVGASFLPLAALLLFFMPWIAIITSIAMWVGLGRFARQPEYSPAAGMARTAWILLGLGVLLELFSGAAGLGLLGADAIHSLTLLASCAQLGVYGTVLGALTRLARYMNNRAFEQLVVRNGVLACFILLIGVGMLASGDGSDLRETLFMKLLGWFAVLGALFMYIDLLRKMTRAISFARA